MGSIERRCRCRTAEQRNSCRCPATAVTFRGVYYAHGRKVAAPFATRAEAKRWVASGEADLARGQHVDPRGGQMLFVDWVEQWKLTRTGKPSSRAADESRLKHHVLPTFEMLPLTAIGPLGVRQWVAKLATNDLAPKTVRNCHTLLHKILDDAAEQRLIGTNPCKGTDLPEWVREEPVFLTEQETQRLIAATPERWRPLVVLLAGTGLRWGEAVGLRARWLDLPNTQMLVRWTWNEKHGWQRPKTRRSLRTVRLPERVVDAVAPLWAGRVGDDPIFTATGGGMIRHDSFVTRRRRGDKTYLSAWWRAVRDAELGGKSPTPHDLRHSHASQLIAAGVPLTAIQRRLGHASISVTSDLYGHLLPGVDETLLAAVDLALTPAEELRVPVASPQRQP